MTTGSRVSRSLAGRRVVITRAREQASRFRRLLEEAGAEVLEIPTIRIEPPESWVPLDRAIARLEEFDWLVFTSVNGVESFRKRLVAAGRDSKGLGGLRVAAIGPATGAALEAWGVRPELVPEEFRAEGLVARLQSRLSRGTRVLLPRAARTRDVLVRELERLGAEVCEVPAYRTLPDREGGPALRRALAGEPPDVVTFTSSSTVRAFVGMLGEAESRSLLGRVVVACIGPVTAQTAVELGLPPRIVPSEYTIPALVGAIVDFYRRDARAG